MGASGLWTNKETRLWLFQPGQEGLNAPAFDYDQDLVTFLYAVGVAQIEEGFQNEATHWECGACGRVNEGYENCPGCNGPRLGRMRIAEVTLEGVMPQGLILAELSKGFGMEITRQECGRPDEYRPENVIMRFVDCQITGRWVEDPVIFWSDQVKAMTMFARMSCRFFMRVEEGFKLVRSERER